MRYKWFMISLLTLLGVSLTVPAMANGPALTYQPDTHSLKGVTRVEKRYRSYGHRSQSKISGSVRIAYTWPLGDWNETPYDFNDVSMFGGGLGFDADIGTWVGPAGYFFVFGGNRFDMDDYEKYVAQQEGQRISAEASMLYIRGEVKGIMGRNGPMRPILKAGLGYYFFDGEERFRAGDEYYFAEYNDNYLNNNVGVNIGGELVMRSGNGPAFIVSLDLIYVFDAVRNEFNYDFDEGYSGLTQLKLGVGIGF